MDKRIRSKKRQFQSSKTLGAKKREDVLKARRESRPVPMDVNISYIRETHTPKQTLQRIPIRNSKSLTKKITLPELRGGIRKKKQQTVVNNKGATYALRKPLTKMRATSCSAVLTMSQVGSICWFNAIFTALFYSQYMRFVVKKHARALLRNTQSKLIVRAILEILKGYETHQVSSQVVQYMQPHMFLRNLRATRSNLFNSMLNGSEEAHFNPYVQKILGVLHVPHLHIGFMNNSFVYSGFNVDLPLDPKLWSKINSLSVRGTYVDTNKPEVILINRDLGEPYLQQIWTAQRPHIGIIGGFNSKFHVPIITYNGTRYILDSCILGAELHTKSCSIGHAICGVTCNNRRYVYNGWTTKSADPAMKGSGGIVRDLPCALMPSDWALDRHCLPRIVQL